MFSCACWHRNLVECIFSNVYTSWTSLHTLAFLWGVECSKYTQGESWLPRTLALQLTLCIGFIFLCVSNTFLRKYILGDPHPPPRHYHKVFLGMPLMGFISILVLWFSFPLQYLKALLLSPTAFSGHHKVLVFIFKTLPSVLYSWTFFSYHRLCWVLGPQQETGSSRFKELLGGWRRSPLWIHAARSAGSIQQSPHSTSTNMLDRNPDPSSGKEVFSNTVLFF